MPIDPRIPLGVIPPEHPAVLMQNLAAMQEARDKSRELQQQRLEDQQIHQILEEEGGDFDRALPRIRPINWHAAAAMEKIVNEGRKATADLQNAQFDRELKIIDYISSQFNYVMDPKLPEAEKPRAYSYARAAIMKAVPGAELPEQFDPTWIQQRLASGLSHKEYVESQRRKMPLQPKEMQVGGQTSAVAFDPETGAYTTPTGQDVSGQVSPVPEVPKSPGTLEAAMIAAKEKELNRPLTAQELIELHGKWGKADDRPRVSVNLGGGGMVDAVMANPSLWRDLTPTMKTQLAPILAARGFTAFGAAGKPATGVQATTLNYFNRAKQANEEIEAISKEIAAMGIGGQARLKYGPNWLQSQVGQTYITAQRAFTEARLRKESGAAIPESEYENDQRTYFVQPGDSPQTIAQKARARAAVLAALAYGAGPALHEFYGDEADTMIADLQAISKGQPAVPAAAPKPGGIEVKAPNGKTYKFATQAQADIFKKRAGIP